MLTLFFFGTSVEYQLGVPLFGVLYIIGAIVSSLPALYKHKENQWYNALGASGAVSAILYAQILFHPLHMLYVFFIPMPAIVFGVLYLFYSAKMAKKGVDNLGHDAHFWGAIVGFVFPILLDFRYLTHFYNELINVF